MSLLKIEHLRKHFGNIPVLEDINLSLEKGNVLSIIGQSGMGKSLILKHIIGLLIPDGGRIMFEGEEISSPTKKPVDFLEVRKRFGMLFQGAALFDSKDVGENLAFPLREHTDHTEEEIVEIVAEALSMVGLHDIQRKMPADLSGGMRSRVGLARALVMRPEVMLYDEPTSALDPIMSDKINDLILDLKDKLKMSSVVVTHDMASAYKISDQIAMIHEGKIIFAGTPAEIRASRNPYIQQFISGRRKLHYAVSAQPQEKAAFSRQVDLGRLRRRADVAAQLRLNRNPSVHDSLTGLTNFSQFRSQLSETFARAKRDNKSFALAIGDIDFFGDINENHGQVFGNTVLQSVAAEIRNCVRNETDVTARYHADAFVIIILSDNRKNISDMVERIRANVSDEDFETEKGEIVPVTISFGVALSTPDDQNGQALMERAERALLAAQRAGHNRVEID